MIRQNIKEKIIHFEAANVISKKFISRYFLRFQDYRHFFFNTIIFLTVFKMLVASYDDHLTINIIYDIIMLVFHLLHLMPTMFGAKFEL